MISFMGMCRCFPESFGAFSAEVSADKMSLRFIWCMAVLGLRVIRKIKGHLDQKMMKTMPIGLRRVTISL